MFKKNIYCLLSKEYSHNRWNKVTNGFILFLILSSVFLIALESVNGVEKEYGGVIQSINKLIVLIFTVEYLLRLYISDFTHPANSRLKSILKFMFSFQGLVDLIAIAPFYIPFVFGKDLQFVRLLRLTRFLRVFKLNRYSNSLRIIGEVIKEKRSELIITCFVTFLTLLVASFLMYHIEGDIQPDLFGNVFMSFWWAIETLTTVGYGEVYPVTSFGKVVSSIIAVMGIGLVALPTGIISAGFISKIDKEKKLDINCPHCGEKIIR